jgi:hypothetical protein
MKNRFLAFLVALFLLFPSFAVAAPSQYVDSTSGAVTSVSGSNGAMNVNLAAGTNVAGKVGIDQTTPGTTNGVQINGYSYIADPGNSTTTQLGAGATFTGTIQSSLNANQEDAQITAYSDQPYTVVVNQYVDAGGTQLAQTTTYTRAANTGLNIGYPINAWYFQVTIQNTGASTTTKLALQTTYGPMEQPYVTTNLGNSPSAINEINGVATNPGQLPVASADQYITGAASQSTLNNNILLASASSGWLDTTGYGSVAIQINASAGISGGVVSFVGSNDGINPVPIYLTNTANNTGVTSITPAASTNYYFIGQPTYRYVKAYISTAISGGTVQAYTELRVAPLAGQALPPGTNLIGGIGIIQVAGGSTSYASDPTATYRSLGVIQQGAASNTDVASAAKTTSGNSGVISDISGQAVSALVNVTAVSGTTPVMIASLYTSSDNGTTWKDVYDTQPITATGTYDIPYIAIGGRREWVWTISGSSPSFTFSITTMRGSVSPLIAHSFYDTTWTSTQAIGGSTKSFNIEGCKSVTLTANAGTITTTAPAFEIQFSSDNVNWYVASAPVTSVASSTVAVASTTGMTAKYARVYCSTAGSAATINYVNLYGTN